MSKTARLLELMMTINAKKVFTARELAEEFNVSYRTILRDLEELSSLGVPLYSEVGVHGGYRIIKERILPPVSLKETEAIAIFFAAQSLEYFGALPFKAEIKTALNKFYHSLPQDVKSTIDEMKHRVAFWSPKRPHAAPYLKDLLEAAVSQTSLCIEYDGSHGPQERRIFPVGLYSHNGLWYCPAYCFKRQAFRLFRADRVLNVLPTPPPDAVDVPSMSITEWLEHAERGGQTTLPLKVQLTAEGVRHAQNLLDLETMITMNADRTGTLYGRIPQSEIGYFTELIWSLGTEARLEEPIEIIELIQVKLQKLSHFYKK
ncbi:helix-turn-helix transcriptional regulator [Pullulanibacillus camelliae]|nr:YafY family protein [Pullulanibacillus camelliae]